MSDVILKQMKKEEELVSKEISKVITAALNSKDTIKKADEINGMCGGWPYAPTREMLKLYGKASEAAWKKIKPGYKNFNVSISINSTANKPPTATVQAIFDGEWRGGKSMMVSSGDTIQSLCKSVYGFESYADQVYEANAKALGKSCKVLPAGFGLEFPDIWVPNWKDAPKVCRYPFVKKKAVKVKLPTMQATIDVSSKSAATIYLGNVIIIVELEGKAELTGTKKGVLDASFSLKAYEAELKKGFGPLEAGFKVDMRGNASGGLSLKVFSTKISGLTFSGSLKLLEGAFEVQMGPKPVKMVSKGIAYEGKISLTAKIRILPNPRRAPERVKGRGFELDVSAKEVVVVVVVVGVLVAGGWAIVVGGAAVEGSAVAGGLALAALSGA